MSNLLFSSQFNVDSPDARVILIPIETTLYTSANAHTEKQPFWKKAEIKLGPLFQGLVYTKYSKLEVKDPHSLLYWIIFTQSIKCLKC